jgi:site-specific DNA-methyltransferase (adenine-specific)
MENCEAGAFLKKLGEETVQCMICDPPFGLGEETFDKHYARDSAQVISGYVSAPKDSKSYFEWAKTWICEIPRVLKKDGTFYVVCAWNHVCDIELAIRSTELKIINHIIWKYNFGVATQNKFVSSHYHILRCAKVPEPVFYSRAYFDEAERTPSGGSAQYCDMEDVWTIPKEYNPGLKKNINKLPEKLVEKMILYASKAGDLVADVFMGNFTTAYVARKLGRNVTGCDLNPETCDEHIPKVLALPMGTPVAAKESAKPENYGARITPELRKTILKRYAELKEGRTKKDTVDLLCKEFKRGKVSILNILKT